MAFMQGCLFKVIDGRLYGCLTREVFEAPKLKDNTNPYLHLSCTHIK